MAVASSSARMSRASIERESVAPRRVRVAVAGTVQGVGFRPFVYRLAHSLGLAGFVRNDATGVAIELQGPPASLAEFLSTLVSDAPPRARIRDIIVDDLHVVQDARAFAVEASLGGGAAQTSIPADSCTCGACLRELFDPSNRRYRYPFINCTDCGPRFTIAFGLPYDRASTTMAPFTMCSACQAEYDDPSNRRFHAQPNACDACGPRVSLRFPNGTPYRANDEPDAIRATARAISEGAIVAVKGLGGYHLACRADDADAVARLRARKQRDDKPFAIMVKSVRAARSLVALNRHEARLLVDAARPIVLARARNSHALAPGVAPQKRDLGVMLPYTPIHHLLLADVDAPLVMTSGNRSDEPIAYRNDEALDRLGSIADLFLAHDRDINARCDDSVVRVVSIGGTRQSLFIRRSRGYVPQPIPLPASSPTPLLAVGGQLKNTVCLVRDRTAIEGPHAGDLADPEAFAAWTHGIERLGQLTAITPTTIVHDLHPEYESTRYAQARFELPSFAVQHHHAHLAAVLAEHDETGPAVGVIFDGAGLGTDGAIWGGEVLVGDLGKFSRVGHLRPIRMPGGDAATREPWRMACAWLTDMLGAEPPLPSRLRGVIDEPRWSRMSALSRSHMSPLTTSVGRLLDACAALCGVRSHVTYEGQAAIELEAIADSTNTDSYSLNVIDEDGVLLLDPREMIASVARDADTGCDASSISARVHRGLVYAAALAAHIAADRANLRTVVLSGGVFQNVLLLEALSAVLARSGLRVLVPRHLPPNDGGLAYGQAAIGAWQRSLDVSGDPRAGC